MRTLAQKLEYCKVCTNREVDFEKGGLICSLTKEQAAFEKECPDFNVDEERLKEVAMRKAQIEHADAAGSNGDGTSDMLWGAVWCIGGIIATFADIGYIFYGAIIFGGIQFVQGVIKSNS
ncbi:MAG: hypothetical protein HOI49_10005 [Bacteroidetes bacterium]|jgi:hypothetical protein|nr:hypothetical protein [Bacteroidota bacterium]